MKAMQRIGLLLSLVFLLPALFFSVYEISSLNKDEKMIQEIYTKQLDAILFSINQYSDDILSSWVSKIEMGLEKTPTQESNVTVIQDLLTFNSSLTHIFVTDTVNGALAIKIISLTDSSSQLEPGIKSALTSHAKQIQQLISYKKSGFQKVDILSFEANGSVKLQSIVFLSDAIGNRLRLTGLVIDPEVFIQDLVGPRLQVVARDQFILSAFKKGQPAAIYVTQNADSLNLNNELLTRSFWLFPNYEIGIRTKGASLKAVIQERTYTNLLLLLSLDVVLIAAVILVFRNVKKEVRLAESKADFVSNVSHEIRTPLALISMFSETLEMGRVKSDDKRQEYYRIISKESQRLTGIVNRILNFSQTEANKKTLNIETLSANKEVKDILNTYDFHLENKGFNYQLMEGDDIRIKADKEAFIESIINLIDNAVKYSVDQKQLEISITKDNDYGCITVKDNGVGIRAADQKHIFEKFYRVPSGNLAKARGTGLGLSLVKQLMEAQKGKITVKSEPEKGSAFTLHFPLALNS